LISFGGSDNAPHIALQEKVKKKIALREGSGGCWLTLAGATVFAAVILFATWGMTGIRLEEEGLPAGASEYCFEPPCFDLPFEFYPLTFNHLENRRGRGEMLPSDSFIIELTDKQSNKFFPNLNLGEHWKVTALYWSDGTLGSVFASIFTEPGDNCWSSVSISLWVEPNPPGVTTGVTNIVSYALGVPVRAVFHVHDERNDEIKSTSLFAYFEM
jgi:hypothetical protein